MTVKSINEAWARVNEIFPTDYDKDERSSERAGYPIYRSRIEHYDYICDLGTRLEINLASGRTINIWIDDSEAAAEAAEAAADVEMVENVLTVGLFDKDSEKQEVSTMAAKRIVSNILIDDFDIFAFTMIECNGVYKMQSTGRIVFEPSIRIEIATDSEIEIDEIIRALKKALNQESIMHKMTKSKIYFK